MRNKATAKHRMDAEHRKLEEFCAIHLAYLAAKDGTAAELAAKEARDALLATFGANDFANAIAVSIGMRSVLVKARDALTVAAATAA